MPYDGPGRLDIVVKRAFASKSVLYGPLRVFFRFVFHLEIPLAFFENGLRLIHPYNVIIHPETRLGNNISIYHNVTLAVKKTGKHIGAPVVEDNVVIYPHSVILGNVRIGKNSVVGAGSVVVHDVPAHCSVAGNPARVVGEVLTSGSSK